MGALGASLGGKVPPFVGRANDASARGVNQDRRTTRRSIITPSSSRNNLTDLNGPAHGVAKDHFLCAGHGVHRDGFFKGPGLCKKGRPPDPRKQALTQRWSPPMSVQKHEEENPWDPSRGSMMGRAVPLVPHWAVYAQPRGAMYLSVFLRRQVAHAP